MHIDRSGNGRVLVATVAKHDATTTLFFGRLSDRMPLRIVELVPRSFRHVLASIRAEAHLAEALGGAAVLIVSRGLLEFGNLVAGAGALGIPCFYFIDDNLMVLRDEGHADARHARGYSHDTVRRRLRAFDGVLCATDSLRTYFLQNRLHERAWLYPPVAAAPSARRRPDDHRLRLAFFGGGHRREPFVRIVLPAIRQFAATGREVVVFAAGIDDLPVDGPGVTVVRLPYERDYDTALHALAMHGIDVLLHPSSETANNQYKNPHVLINARTLGAAPIFSDAPPYDALAAEGVCLLAAQTPQAWLDALMTVADPAVRAQLAGRIAAYCERHFNGDVNVAWLSDMLRDAPSRRRKRVPLLGVRLGGGFVLDLMRRAAPEGG